MVLAMILGTSSSVAQESPKYSYELMNDPSSFVILSSSFSLDFKDVAFEKSLMVSGWQDALNGRWTGNEETAEMFLPLVGKGIKTLELLCHSSPTKQEQILTVHDGDSEIWQGAVQSDSVNRIRFNLHNGNKNLVLHRLKFSFSIREEAASEKDSRKLAVNFRFLNINHRGAPERTRSARVKDATSGILLKNDEVLLIPLASSQTVPCDLGFEVSGARPNAKVWLVSKNGEVKEKNLGKDLRLHLPRSSVGVDWIAVGFSESCTLESARLVREPSAASKPNVLLLSLDTVRADDMPFYGNEIVHCPNLSLLAEEGVVFENGFSQCDGTNPSFSSIMSSRYVHEHGVLNQIMPLSDKFETIAEVLKKDGYNTAAFTSVVFLSADNSGLSQGFDVYNCVTDWLRRDRQAHETTDAFLTWLVVGASEPYFVWLHYFDAHTPYRPPKDIAKKYYPGNPVNPELPPLKETLPGALRRNYSWLGPVTDPEYPYLMHLGEIERIDGQVGRIWSSIKGAAGWENMVAMLTADHGESFGEKNVYFAHHGMHDANLHVPFVWRTPSTRVAGKRYAPLVQTIDIAPTIFSLLGITETPQVSGSSLARLVWPEVAKGVDFVEQNQVFAVQVAQPPMAAGMVRTKHAKLVVPNPSLQDTYLNYEEALYDLRKDPAEDVNIIQGATHEALRLRGIYDQWYVGADVISARYQETLDKDKLNALKDLGYAN